MSDQDQAHSSPSTAGQGGTEESEPLAPWEVGKKKQPQAPEPLHYAAGQNPPAGYAPPGAPPQYGAGQPYGASPYGAPQAQPGYGQPPYSAPGQPAYGQPPYGQPPYGQPPYGAPYPGQGAYAGRPMRTGTGGMPDYMKWLAPVLGVIVVIGFLVYELVPANIGPAPLTKFVSPDKRFSVSAPTSWSTTTTLPDSANDITAGGALFKNGAAKVDITTDSVAAVKAHSLLTGSGSGADALTQDPAIALHQMYHGRLESQMQSYQEQPTTSMQTNLGAAEVSEFTGVGGMFGLGGQMHGYQASLSDGENTYEIVTECPEKSWAGLKPMFLQIIKSMAPADGKPVMSLDDLGGSTGTGASPDNSNSTSQPTSGPPAIAPPPPPPPPGSFGDDNSD